LPLKNPGLGVRVELSRLEALSNLVGELSTQDNGLLLQHQQYRTITQRLQYWLQGFQQLCHDLTQSSQVTPEEGLLQILGLQSTAEQSTGEQHPTAKPLPLAEIYQTASEDIFRTLSTDITKLEEIWQDMQALTRQSKAILNRRQQTLKQVQTNLLQARMLPIGEILNRFPRMLRDLSHRHQKQVNLQLEGANTLVDRAILERLYDPLVHLVRNAFDHGIELPDQRLAEGKPPQGKITIRTEHRGNYTYIQVEDDGQGIDPDKIRARLVELNLLSEAEIFGLSQAQLWDYLFQAGFSTTSQANELSGRGVGLDTVQIQVKALKGSISLDSQPGLGTIFTLRLPYTLSVAQLLVCSVEQGLLAVPVNELVAVVGLKTTNLEQQGSEFFYHFDGKRVPLLTPLVLPALGARERSLLRPIAADDVTPEQLISAQRPVAGATLLIFSHGLNSLAIQVSQTVLQQELIIKPFSPLVSPPPYLLGCTLLGNGKLVPILDPPALLRHWTSWQRAGEQPLTDTAPHSPAILVVDDSLTIRQNLTITLRREGYQVLQAENGAEALATLRQQRQIQAVFSDIDMPGMNGLEFLQQARQQISQTLPIIMLTSRSSAKVQQLASRLGASGYLTKPFLEVELLKLLKNALQK
jgi:two-component system, chemotaxis family, sensor histidine kinase and response regulator PixL